MEGKAPGRNRCNNFSSDEITILIELVKKHAEIIECRLTNTTTNGEKNAVWEELSADFNSLSPTDRNTKMLRSKWDSLKKTARRDYTNFNNSGGGSARNFTAHVESTLEIIGVNFLGTDGDSDHTGYCMTEVEDKVTPKMIKKEWPKWNQSTSKNADTKEIKSNDSIASTSTYVLQINDTDTQASEETVTQIFIPETASTESTQKILKKEQSSDEVPLQVIQENIQTEMPPLVAIKPKFVVNETKIPRKRNISSSSSEECSTITTKKQELMDLQMKLLLEDHQRKMEKYNNDEKEQKLELMNLQMKLMLEEHQRKMKKYNNDEKEHKLRLAILELEYKQKLSNLNK